MINNKNLITLLKKPLVVKDLYDKEIERIAYKNNGEFKLDENTQLYVANKAFNIVCKESTINVSWAECVAIFDLMER